VPVSADRVLGDPVRNSAGVQAALSPFLQKAPEAGVERLGSRDRAR